MDWPPAELLGVCSAAGQTLEVVPSVSAPTVGSTLKVDVHYSGTGVPDLAAFDLTLSFNPAVLDFKGADFANFLGDEQTIPAQAVTGTIPATAQVFEVSLLTPAALAAVQPSAFTLFTADFDVVGDGATALSVSLNAPLSDELGNPIAPPGGVPIVPGPVTARSATEIPALSGWSLLFLAGALTGAALFLLRRMT